MRLSDGSAIWVRLWVDPSPCSSIVVCVEVSPHWPSSARGQFPVPKSPGSSWSRVHPSHIPSILELSEFSAFSPILFTESVTGFKWVNIVSSDWWSDGENTSSPSVVVSSIGVLIWYCDWGVVVVWSVDDFGVDYAQDWQLVCAWYVSFDWIAAITSEASCPAVWLDWPLLYLISHTFLYVVQQVLVLFFTNLLCHAQPQEQAQHERCLV